MTASGGKMIASKTLSSDIIVKIQDCKGTNNFANHQKTTH